MKVIQEAYLVHWIRYLLLHCMAYTYFFPYKLTIRSFLHTFIKICPKESFTDHGFEQFIKAYQQKMRCI